jgi:hypothetical protein
MPSIDPTIHGNGLFDDDTFDRRHSTPSPADPILAMIAEAERLAEVASPIRDRADTMWFALNRGEPVEGDGNTAWRCTARLQPSRRRKPSGSSAWRARRRPRSPARLLSCYFCSLLVVPRSTSTSSSPVFATSNGASPAGKRVPEAELASRCREVWAEYPL